MNHIIFDLDGTLLASMHIWRTVGIDYLQKFGIAAPEGFFNFMKEHTITQTCEHMSNVLGVPQTPKEIAAGIADVVDHAYRYEVALKPNVLKFLEQEHAKGTKMCILTASENSFVLPAINRLDLHKYFEFIMPCSEINSSKDFSLPYEVAMERMGGTIDSTLVMEDALYAIKGAKSGGFTVYAVAEDTAMDDYDEIIATADKYIIDFKEILD